MRDKFEFEQPYKQAESKIQVTGKNKAISKIKPL